MVNKTREFLENSDILDRVVKDMDILGYVGEKENKFLGYLITISRKLGEPLSGIAVSSSGAGKSKLVETLQLLTPPEDFVFISRLTPQALYYMPTDYLKHKLLIIEERSGSELADYAIRTLQSKGVLMLALPIKRQTVFFKVRGPVSVLETTTSCKLNLENISRCFILHLDESNEQTERIHKYQRFLKTEDGVHISKSTRKIISFHQELQRQLKEARVIIPYAEKLTFPSNAPILRRDNQKLLTLIEAVTLLYQYQRKVFNKEGTVYIESTLEDYKTAFNIFKAAYRNNSILIRPRAYMLYQNIARINKETFTRRDIAIMSGWPAHMVRDNIRYLEDSGLLEIIQKNKGKENLYKLNNAIELIKPEELEG